MQLNYGHTIVGTLCPHFPIAILQCGVRKQNNFCILLCSFSFCRIFSLLTIAAFSLKCCDFSFPSTQASLQKFPSSPTSYQADQLTNFSSHPHHSCFTLTPRFLLLLQDLHGGNPRLTHYTTANTIFIHMLTHYTITVAWVKGAQDEVKRTKGPPAKSWGLESP